MGAPSSVDDACGVQAQQQEADRGDEHAEADGGAPSAPGQRRFHGGVLDALLLLGIRNVRRHGRAPGRWFRRCPNGHTISRHSITSHATEKRRYAPAPMTEMAEIPWPRSPLWMVVLALACEEPMHPYRMQTLIKQRGKDLVANVAQRNSVYQTIDALTRAGLLAVRETSRDENRPERTVYEATEQGREAVLAWLRSALSTPMPEYPMFPAALATPDPRLKPELRGLLEVRLATLEANLPALEKTWPGLPRIFLIEN